MRPSRTRPRDLELNTNPLHRLLFWILLMVSFFGIITLFRGFFSLFRFSSTSDVHTLLALAGVFLMLSPWAVRLPSGAQWRPAMAMVTVGMFLLPIPLTPLVALPGLLYINLRSKNRWWQYPLTFGHVGLGLYVGGKVFRGLVPTSSLHLPDQHLPYVHLPEVLPAAVLGLLAHLIVNRLVSAMIIAQREAKPWFRQTILSFRDLNWAHFNMYLLSILTAAVYQDQGVWGLILVGVLQVGLYKSVSYYSRMHRWQQAARTDGLTGLGNRGAWQQFANSLERGSLAGTLVLMDLNNFKAVNDVHGHAVGDEVLRDLATTLRRELDKSAQVFRYGGDEFVLFFSHSALQEQEVHYRLDTVTSQMNAVWGLRGLPVKASLGMACWPAEAQTIGELFELADSRMYKAKHQSKAGRQTTLHI